MLFVSFQCLTTLESIQPKKIIMIIITIGPDIFTGPAVVTLTY